MRRFSPIAFVLGLLGSSLLMGSPAFAEQPHLPKLQLLKEDRILVLAPHPDDEVLGCAGVIQEAVARKLPIRIVFFTYGDNNELSFFLYRKHPVLVSKAVRGMGEIRYQEAHKAAQILGVPAESLIFLGYPDWGTLDIWNSHWGRRTAYRSMLTRVFAVPYPNAYRKGAFYKGEEALADLKAVLQDFRPTKIFVSHPADNHPDHRALYLFAQVALMDLSESIHAQLYPYLVHYRRWPRPVRQPHRSTFPPPTALEKEISWTQFELSEQQIERKQAALRAHKSQYNAGPRSMSSFVRKNELFGDFPAIDLKGSGVGLSQEEVPEEFTDQEKAAFVGLQYHHIRMEGSTFVLSLEFSRPLGEEVGVCVYAYGHRRDRPFQEMPKLHIRLGAFRHRIDNEGERLPFESIQVTRQAKRITLRIPLEILGDPDALLLSAHTYFADVPLDWVSWRVVVLHKSYAAASDGKEAKLTTALGA